MINKKQYKEIKRLLFKVDGAERESFEENDRFLIGPQGPQGLIGLRGEDGLPGPMGPQGIPGINGKDGINGIDGKDGYSPKKGKDYLTDDEIKKMLYDISQRIPKGGGSMSRQISNNGTVITTRYKDINLIGTGGLSITATDNNTTKKTDITLNVSSGVSSVSNSDSSLTFSPTTGNVIGSLNLAHSNNFTALQGVTLTSLGTTIIDGFQLFNTTAAANNFQQYSPYSHFKGFGWNTQASASQAQEWRFGQRITQVGFGAPTNQFVFQSQQNGGGWTDKVLFGGTYALTVNGNTNMTGQFLAQGVGTFNTSVSANGLFTAYGGLTAQSAFIALNSATFYSLIHSNDDNFYYDHTNASLTLGNAANNAVATLYTNSLLTQTAPNPGALTAGLTQIIGFPTSPMISQDNAGSHYTANGTTYTFKVAAIDNTTGLAGAFSATNNFTDSGGAVPFQIDFSWTAPVSAPNGISQYYIGLSTDGGATWNYRLTGSNSTSFIDNDGSYPNPSVTQVPGYTANGSTLGNTYTVYAESIFGGTMVYSTTPQAGSTIDPNDNNQYVANLSWSGTTTYKMVRSGNLTGAYESNGTTLNDDNTFSWSASGTVTPTSYIKPSGWFVKDTASFSDTPTLIVQSTNASTPTPYIDFRDNTNTSVGKLGVVGGVMQTDEIFQSLEGYNAVDGTPGATASPSGLVFKNGLFISGSPTPSGTAGGDLTGTYPNPTIGASKVTYAKMQNVSANSKLLGSGASGAGSSPSEITLGTGLTMTGTTLSATGGAFLQEKHSSTATFGTYTTVIPVDDTIPQNTEGTELLTVTLTPASASNILDITVSIHFSSNTAGDVPVFALFQDSTADAFASGWGYIISNGVPQTTSFTNTIVAGTTSATTIKLRVGPSSGNLNINGNSIQRYLGGSLITSLIVREITP